MSNSIFAHNDVVCALDNAPMAVVVCAKDNNQVLYANQCATQLFDFANNKHITDSFAKLVEYADDGKSHEWQVQGSTKVYSANINLTTWDTVPAYILYISIAQVETERIDEYWKVIINGLPGGISVLRISPDNTITPEYISDGFCALTLMTQQQAMALYSADAFAGLHPDDVDQCKKSMMDFVNSGDKYCEFRARYLRGDGSYIWLRDRVSMDVTPYGDTLMYCIYADITKEVEEKQSLHARYEERVRQHYMARDGSELIVGHSNITQNRIVNMLNFTHSTMFDDVASDRRKLFCTLADCVVDPQERQKFLDTFLNEAILSAYVNQDTVIEQEFLFKLDNEEYGRHVRIRASLVEITDTQDVVGIFSITDITDQAMRSRILDSMSSIVHDYIADISLFEDEFSIISSRPGAHVIPKENGSFSKRIEFMTGSVIVEKDREMYARELNCDTIHKRLSNELCYTITYSMITENGTLCTKSNTFFAVDLRIGRVCLVCTDITESVVELEKALDDAKKAEQAKSNFLASMSHDIRTPLNAIMGMTAIALSSPDDNKRIQSCLQKISVANNQLFSLVNDVLDMRLLEHSKIVFSPIDLSLTDVIDQVSAIIESPAKGAGVQFVVKTNDINNNYFRGDIVRINQIFINLLTNAIKFTPRGGKVEFVQKQIKAHNPDNCVRYRFTVKDNGMGMSEDFLDRIFLPFEREGRAAHIEGTGLGLSICKGIIDLMGGTISVKSKINKGTEFVVELEFDKIDNAVNASPDLNVLNSNVGHEKDFEGRVFLIAEDNAINSELISEILSMGGGKSVVAINGVDAVAQFKNNKPGTYDAILMDIQMPLMNGYEATRAIRSLKRADAKQIPIIAMTANAFAEDVRNSLDAGMNAHVAKPINIDILRSTLKEHLIPKK